MNLEYLNFKKKGVIFDIKKFKEIKSHAWVPTPYLIEKNKIIVFFAGRNKKNESDTWYFIYDIEKEKIIKISDKPVLKRGNLGSFDDSAAIPSHLIKIRNKYYLYYVGWTRGFKVPYFSNIGLAVSNNVKGPYKKISKSPILGKSKYDPYFVATCFVVKEKKRFEMYYTSNLLWQKIKGLAQPKYLIKIAYSKNGIDWISKNEKVINFTNKNETAITRPWVIKIKNETYMFYSVKKKYYKIKTSVYKKNKWIRKKIFKFENKNLKFDNISQEYSSLIKFKNNIYMFYNGNDYGKQGIGLAIAKLNEKKN